MLEEAEAESSRLPLRQATAGDHHHDDRRYDHHDSRSHSASGSQSEWSEIPLVYVLS